MKWIIESPVKILEVAREVMECTTGEKIYILNGPMGVGKTTFMKAVAQSLGVNDDVTSPTFAIVNEYLAGDNRPVYHFDFYRVESIDEALDFGIEEYLYSGNRCFIEWPDVIESLLPERRVICHFTELTDGSRELVLEIIGE